MVLEGLMNGKGCTTGPRASVGSCSYCGAPFVGGEQTVHKEKGTYHPCCVGKAEKETIMQQDKDLDNIICSYRGELAEYEVCDRGLNLQVFVFGRLNTSYLLPKLLVKKISMVLE